MKKLFLLMALVAMSVTASAETFDYFLFSYEVKTPPSGNNPGTVACTGLSAQGEALEAFGAGIPHYVVHNGKRYYVTSVAASAFEGNTNVGVLYLPYGLTTIGKEAFKGSKLNEIYIPSSIRSIQSLAFSGCENLFRVNMVITLPDSVTISDDAFTKCTGTRVLTFPFVSNLSECSKLVKADCFSTISRSSLAYDFYLDNGAQVVVTQAPTATADGEFTIVGFDTSADSENAKNGILQISEAVVTPSGYDEQFRYVAVSDSACYNSSVIKQLDLSGGSYIKTIGRTAFKSCYKLTTVNVGNVVSIGQSAFLDCTNLTTATWSNQLQELGNYAFCYTGLTHDIFLPVGFKFLGARAFSNVKSKNILIPSTLNQITKTSLENMDYLENLYFNVNFFNIVMSFGTTPKSCKVYVPVGCKDKISSTSGWRHFSTIQEGAFDFAYQKNMNSVYKMTVTSTKPVTVGEETYDGTAKYVYTPSLVGASKFIPSPYESDRMVGDTRRYLITEIGDSCFAGSSIAKIDFFKMPHLTRIGRKAFYGSALTSAELPGNEISLGEDAFTNCTSLTEIVTSYYCTWDGKFYGNNADNFNYFSSNYYVTNAMKSLNAYDYDGNYNCGERVAPCFTADQTTFLLAVQAHLKYADSNLPSKPRYVTSYDAATGIAATSSGLDYMVAGRGIIITDLTPGTLYKIPRYYGTYSDSNTSILVPNSRSSAYSIGGRSGAYYWDYENLKFVKPTGRFYLPAGQAYLEVKNGGDEIYLDLFPGSQAKGDLNGDGIVDITDVNMAINMVLGKTEKTTAADVDGSGDVDITDVNAIINLMLGK